MNFLLSRFVVVACILGLLGGVGRAAEPDKVNVIVIVADDLGARDLACYGSTYYRTPYLDRLAADGVKFTDAYAAAPVCSPSRAALLTGQYPARLHLTDWLPGRPDRPDQRLLRPTLAPGLPAATPTLARALRSAGYATAHIGKWHLGGKGAEPEQHGFGLNVAGDHTGTPLSWFAPFRSAEGRVMPGLEKAANGEYLTDQLTVEAEQFIERNRGRPFFLHLAHYAVHIPLRAKPGLAAKYPADRPPGTQNNPIYAAMIESLDGSVGRIVGTLERLKLSGRTAVVFTSDNGGLCVKEGPDTPATLNAPYRDGKGYLYEGGIRVPLLVKWPGIARPGSTSNALASGTDLMPTILDLCAVSSGVTTDGVSLRPALRGEALKRDALYWHYPHYSNQGGRPGGAIRVGGLKLIEHFEDGRTELYDLAKDVGESRNLVEERADDAKALAARLSAWRRAVGARTTKPNPDYAPNVQAADGTIALTARAADVHGVQLRYEPLPHKETLGYWTRTSDWASWEFTVRVPGTFAIEALQGCGKGHGGSEVEFAVAEQVLAMTVEDTGHFQNFKSRAIGRVKLDKPGRYTLSVKPRTKPGAAVMDLRAVALQRIDN